MPPQILELAKRLDNLRDQLDAIRVKTRSNQRERELLKLRVAASREIYRLISIDVKANSKAYRDATAELKKANTAMRRAIVDPRTYDEAMELVVRGIEYVGRIREYHCPGGGGHVISSPRCPHHPNERPRPRRS